MQARAGLSSPGMAGPPRWCQGHRDERLSRDPPGRLWAWDQAGQPTDKLRACIPGTDHLPWGMDHLLACTVALVAMVRRLATVLHPVAMAVRQATVAPVAPVAMARLLAMGLRPAVTAWAPAGQEAMVPRQAMAPHRGKAMVPHQEKARSEEDTACRLQETTVPHRSKAEARTEATVATEAVIEGVTEAATEATVATATAATEDAVEVY